MAYDPELPSWPLAEWVRLFGHLSPATCHLPPATCHLPPATSHFFSRKRFFYVNWWSSKWCIKLSYFGAKRKHSRGFAASTFKNGTLWLTMRIFFSSFLLLLINTSFREKKSFSFAESWMLVCRWVQILIKREVSKHLCFFCVYTNNHLCEIIYQRSVFIKMHKNKQYNIGATKLFCQHLNSIVFDELFINYVNKVVTCPLLVAPSKQVNE